jgi:hypothetical protein
MESLYERENLTGRGLVQIAGRLIGKQKSRVVHQCAGKRHTLLLAA